MAHSPNQTFSDCLVDNLDYVQVQSFFLNSLHSLSPEAFFLKNFLSIAMLMKYHISVCVCVCITPQHLPLVNEYPMVEICLIFVRTCLPKSNILTPQLGKWVSETYSSLLKIRRFHWDITIIVHFVTSQRSKETHIECFNLEKRGKMVQVQHNTTTPETE